MYAIEFSAIPKDGMIKLPSEISLIDSEVKFIALMNQNLYENKIAQKIQFKSISLATKDTKFDRESANER